MPYIEPLDREFFDMVVNSIALKLAMDGLTLDDEKGVLIYNLSKVDEKKQDGAFNYFITKLLVKLGWVDYDSGYYDTAGSDNAKILKEFLIDMCKKVYNPKYYNYNRMIGMLTCCLKEFIRRYKKEAMCVKILLNSVIDELYDFTIGPYEDKKIEENGDVTK